MRDTKIINPLIVIREILLELRIDKRCLEVMADGQNPNRNGSMDCSSQEECDKYHFPYPVVQLSKDTSQSIMELDINWNEFQFH